VRIAERAEMPEARALVAYETKVFIPPPPAKRATQAPRLPSIEDFPFPGQNEFRPKRSELAGKDHLEKRRLGLLQRLALVGLGGGEDEQEQEQKTPKPRSPEPTKRRDLWERRHVG
jgi:cell division protein FtsZ